MRRAFLAAAIAVFLFCLFLMMLQASAASRMLAGFERLQEGDFIFVFAAGTGPNPEYAARCKTASDVWHVLKRRGKEVPVVILAGAPKGASATAGKAAKQMLAGHGVPASSVIAIEDLGWGNIGHHTLEEVTLALRFMRERGLKTPIVVSNEWHLVQINASFSRQGAEPIIVPSQNMFPWHFAPTRLCIAALTFFDPDGDSFAYRALLKLRDRLY